MYSLMRLITGGGCQADQSYEQTLLNNDAFQLQDPNQDLALEIGQVLKVTACGYLVENSSSITLSLRLYFTPPIGDRVLIAQVDRPSNQQQGNPETFELSILVTPLSMVDSTHATCLVSGLFFTKLGNQVTGQTFTETLGQTVDCNVSAPTVDLMALYDNPNEDPAYNASLSYVQTLFERLGDPAS